jgi:SAM-dependent methyltransferase
VSLKESSSESRSEEDVFASGAYWREYYASLGHENQEVGEFLIEAAQSVSAPRLKILDAGCGPTLLYWAVFVPGNNQVHGFDISPANIKGSRACIEAARRGEFDPGLVEAAGHAVRAMGSSVTPESHLVAKAEQVASLGVADLSRRWPYQSEQFDFIQSCFAFENLPDWKSFDAALAEACRVLGPGGCLALAHSSNGTSWICDNRRFPTLFVTAEVIREKLERSGLQEISVREIESADAEWRTQGYSKLMLASARKRNVT